MSKTFAAIFAAAVLGAGWSWADEAGRTEKGSSSAKATQSRRVGLSDCQIAAWLITESGVHERVGEFAAQQAHNSAVQQFAQTAAQSHKELLAQFPMPAKGEGGDANDAAKTLKEIAQRWEETAGNNRQVLGFRGTDESQAPADNAGTAAERLTALRKKMQEQRKIIGEARSDRRTEVASAETPADRVAEFRSEGREVREARQELNALRRQRVQVLRDVAQAGNETAGRASLSARIPQVLRTVAQVVQGVGTKGGAATTIADIEQQAANRMAEAITQTLKEKQGRDFDVAYLGYECLSQLRMISMLEVAKENASEDLRPALDRSLASAQERLRQSHELMQQVASSDEG
jgi:hypothetical protein